MDECMPAGRRVNSSRLSAELRRGHSLKQLTGEVLTSTEAGGVHVEEAAAALPGRLRAPRLRNRQTASRVGAAGACATRSPSAPHGLAGRRTDGEIGRETDRQTDCIDRHETDSTPLSPPSAPRSDSFRWRRAKTRRSARRQPRGDDGD
uniref:Uncharacterized protein n=1 Tax=Plectus sambesii TaxID=2011161 RepID=A0A914W9B1_9BILA